MRSYDEVRKDWKTLWDIAPAGDMTGGYEDQYDLDKLLKSPTKRTARECMENQIHYWFQVGPGDEGECQPVDWFIENNPEVRAIAEKYGHA
jgi:hypothetical protein